MEKAIPPPQLDSDALVFFGATGDLAYKQIFPALQALVAHDGLDLPLIGIARSGWTLGKLQQRAHASIAQAAKDQGGQVDEPAFARLIARLKFVGGDYNDPATFKLLKQTLGPARRPLHYLAIPPSLFATVARACSRPAARTAHASLWKNRSDAIWRRRGNSTPH
jgi:glucose-6-phosphate 1-dehydrogenase